jgi:rhomboid protease GluP
MQNAATPEDVTVKRTQSRSTNPYTITIALITINVLVFVAMIVSGVSLVQPATREMIRWGADFAPLTLGAGQWWRLLTACFLHFGIVHIGLNMYVLYQIGPFIEVVFGRIRYLIIYLLAGLAGSAVSLWVHPYAVGAGASGAIFGLYGAVFAFLLMKRRSLRPEAVNSIGRSAGIFIVYNVVFGAASGTTDLSAHLGGLASGFSAGLLLVPTIRQSR